MEEKKIYLKKNEEYSEESNLGTATIEETHEESPVIKVETTGPKTKNGIIVNSLFVKIRKDPSLDSEVLGVLREGDRVVIIGKKGKFIKILTSTNTIAYIFSGFVKEE